MSDIFQMHFVTSVYLSDCARGRTAHTFRKTRVTKSDVRGADVHILVFFKKTGIDANTNSRTVVESKVHSNIEGSLSIYCRILRNFRIQYLGHKRVVYTRGLYLSDIFHYRFSVKMDGLAGKTLAGAFTLFKIGQVTTRPDALNFICVTLTPNVKFFSEVGSTNKFSRVTIAGLLGSGTSAKQIRVSACPTSVNAATGLAVEAPNVFRPGGAQPLFKSREGSNADSANKHVID